MYIVFHMVWTNVVHHEFDVTNIEASCANTGCYHDISTSIFEVLDESLSVDLVLASVKHDDLMPHLEKLFEEFICLSLAINKDENTSFLFPLLNKDIKSCELVFIVQNLN